MIIFIISFSSVTGYNIFFLGDSNYEGIFKFNQNLSLPIAHFILQRHDYILHNAKYLIKSLNTQHVDIVCLVKFSYKQWISYCNFIIQ